MVKVSEHIVQIREDLRDAWEVFSREKTPLAGSLSIASSRARQHVVDEARDLLRDVPEEDLGVRLVSQELRGGFTRRAMQLAKGTMTLGILDAADCALLAREHLAHGGEGFLQELHTELLLAKHNASLWLKGSGSKEAPYVASWYSRKEFMPLLDSLRDASLSAESPVHLINTTDKSSWTIVPQDKIVREIEGKVLVLPFNSASVKPLNSFELAITFSATLTEGDGSRTFPYRGAAGGEQFVLMMRRLAEAAGHEIYGYDPSSSSKSNLCRISSPSLRINRNA